MMTPVCTPIMLPAGTFFSCHSPEWVLHKDRWLHSGSLVVSPQVQEYQQTVSLTQIGPAMSRLSGIRVDTICGNAALAALPRWSAALVLLQQLQAFNFRASISVFVLICSSSSCVHYFSVFLLLMVVFSFFGPCCSWFPSEFSLIQDQDLCFLL